MTIEIVVMNSNGAALGADSASFFPAVGARYPERVFTHADKMFDLSSVGSPIGAMVYGKLHVDGEPWGAVLRKFCEEHSAASCLESTARALVAFLASKFEGAGGRRCDLEASKGARLLECIDGQPDSEMTEQRESDVLSGSAAAAPGPG